MWFSFPIHSFFVKSAGSFSTSDTSTEFQWRMLGKTKGLELLNENEPPNVDEVHTVSLSIEAMISIVNALVLLESRDSVQYVLYCNVLMIVGDIAICVGGNDDRWLHRYPNVNREVVKEMTNVAWVPVLTALSFLLSRTQEEVGCNKIYQIYISSNASFA